MTNKPLIDDPLHPDFEATPIVESEIDPEFVEMLLSGCGEGSDEGMTADEFKAWLRQRCDSISI